MGASEGTARPDGRRSEWALASAAALTVVPWTVFGLLGRLPRRDDRGRRVTQVVLLDTQVWRAWSLVAGAVLLAVLLLLLLLVLARRARGGARVVTAAVGGTLWLGVAALLAVVAFFGLLGTGGRSEVVTGADGRRVMLTADSVDGDVTAVYQPSGRVTWVAEPAGPEVDRWQHPCTLVSRPDLTGTVRCGSTAQEIGPPP
ncbi:hypothetical protein [Phycicoccus flavus]|uniref:hypothetical protein n=1 Tax=Phycicoccus flavus TaxID=2502783 RepID=UPI000FEB69EB|nr:hypothetical protein [Phycicoccus flavus]NHA68561.1 hypothetical protein [Phycicoccus flavus]